MAYLTSPVIIEQFKGIREYNGVTNGNAISALSAQNVEIVQAETGSNTALKSVAGNKIAYELPSSYKIIDIFESNQEDVSYIMIYAENDTKGTLFYVDPLTLTVQTIIDDFTKTGEANGITMSSSAYDVFVFTNGKEAKTVCFTEDSAYGDKVKTITAKDYQGRNIHWLSMTDWNGFLVVASEYGVHSSHQNDIYTWNENPQDVADAWYIDFSKKVTAVVSFTNGLYIFTKDDTTFLSATPNDMSNSVMKTAAMNGCLSYKSLVKHDTYLFFYDPKQKNIYYMTITDTGQTRPTGPVAKEIQSYFAHVKNVRMTSCIYATRNEIWLKIDDNLLIFDYTQQEWIKRAEQDITAIALIQNNVYTAYSNHVYVENVNLDFDGVFFPAEYKATMINLGSNSNLKKQKTPLLIVVDNNYVNDFWVELTVNGKKKNPKHIKVPIVASGYYAGNEDEATDLNTYGTAKYSGNDDYAKKVVEVSTPQTWYTLAFRIYTDALEQGFFINSIELKNIKIKTKTKGR